MSLKLCTDQLGNNNLLQKKLQKNPNQNPHLRNHGSNKVLCQDLGIKGVRSQKKENVMSLHLDIQEMPGILF